MTNSEKESWIICNGRIVDPDQGVDETADIALSDGKLVRPEQAGHRARRFDARGCLVAPGFIDIHVHFREPGDEEAETIASGADAARRGGFGTVLMMPNTQPPIDRPELVCKQIKKAKYHQPFRILVAGCVSLLREGRELADMEGMAREGVVAFTDDGSTVPDHLIRQASATAAKLNIPIFDHAIDPVVAANGILHQGPIAEMLKVPGISSEAETTIVRRDIEVAAEQSARIHIQHVSTAGAVTLIKEARARNISITAEATPHHIALTEDDAACGSAIFKVNPPIRSATDREAILNGVVDGTISALATDHAPHTSSSKALGLTKAPFGAIGLETAIGVTYAELVASGRMTAIEWVKRWTAGPAAILRLPCPSLKEGEPADVVVINIDTPWKVMSAMFSSRSRNTPFEGKELWGQPVALFLDGRLVWAKDVSQRG